jgi:hypothetical protein
MKRISVLLLSCALLAIFSSGCLYAVRYDGTYHGRVVDQETREPIQGVVVLGTWSVYHFSPAGGYHTYHNAREAVTDKNGEFSIPGEGLRILSSLEPMDFIIFKAGYKYREYQWSTLKIDIPRKEEEQTKWEGDMPVFPLKKMSTEERTKGHDTPDPPMEASFEKVMLMLKEIDKDRIERGLDARGLWHGVSY